MTKKILILALLSIHCVFSAEQERAEQNGGLTDMAKTFLARLRDIQENGVILDSKTLHQPKSQRSDEEIIQEIMHTGNITQDMNCKVTYKNGSTQFYYMCAVALDPKTIQSIEILEPLF